MKITLKTSNPTGYPRTQWVRYGSEDAHHVFKTLPCSYINVAKVTVGPYEDSTTFDPAAFNGLNAQPLLSPAVEHTLARVFAPYLTVDGVRHNFVLRHVTDLNKNYTVGTWQLDAGGIIAYLWTYYGKGDDIMQFEMSFFCESKEHLRATHTVSMDVEGPGVRPIARNKPLGALLNGSMLDGQGQRVFGSFLFWHDATGHRQKTLLAEHQYPLYALDLWDGWGPWQAVPPQMPKDVITAQQVSMVNWNYSDPFAHPGFILNKSPGDTGWQPAFGTWQHLATVGGQTAQLMMLEQGIVAQESCRPIHFFEPDGTPVKAANHPDWVSWSEGTHWSSNVSPDRLGRASNRGSTSSSDWDGRDYQHYSCTWLAEDAILNGSEASKFELDMMAEHLISGLTLPSKKPRHSTNGALVGRAAGRTFLGIAYNWLATGNNGLLNHIAQRLKEVELVNRHGLTRVICNDPRVFGQGHCGQIIWEDAISVMGYDALAEVLEGSYLFPIGKRIREQLVEFNRNIIVHGWPPTEPVIAKQIRQDAWPPKPDDWHNRELVNLSHQTEFSIWAIPSLHIGQSQGFQRATEILDKLTIDKFDSHHNVYLGAKTPESSSRSF